MLLAKVDSRVVVFSGDTGNQHKTLKSGVPRGAVLVISRRLLKLENTQRPKTFFDEDLNLAHQK